MLLTQDTQRVSNQTINTYQLSDNSNKVKEGAEWHKTALVATALATFILIGTSCLTFNLFNTTSNSLTPLDLSLASCQWSDEIPTLIRSTLSKNILERLDACYENNQTDSSFLTQLGENYIDNDFPVRGLKCLQKAINKDHTDAMVKLASRYYFGKGIPENLTLAIELFEKAAEKDDREAMNKLGHCYSEGKGIDKNPELAFKFWKNAADKGQLEAIHRLGYCYSRGKGVDINPELAASSWEKGAKKGDSKCMHSLANCYSQGKGVDKNPQLAFKWHLKAAEQKHIYSMQCLIHYYRHGLGVNKDLKQAFEWYQKTIQEHFSDKWFDDWNSNLLKCHEFAMNEYYSC
jgi:tetratricopeptide (TPR) repeat protein